MGKMRYPSLVIRGVLLVVVVVAHFNSHKLYLITSTHSFVPCFPTKRFTKLKNNNNKNLIEQGQVLRDGDSYLRSVRRAVS